jgi:hypothetical protein
MARAGACSPLRAVARRTAVLLGLFTFVVGPAVAIPASACACGALLSNSGLTVDREMAAILWDGSTEDLVVSMNVLGSATDAGWLMPVPGQAEVSVSDIGLLDELEQRTEPEVQRVTNWWPNFNFTEVLGLGDDEPADGSTDDASQSGDTDDSGDDVTVLDQHELGDYTVAQLAANDTEGLNAWLTANGYSLPPALATAMAPYANANWVFVAVKLTAADPADPITGRLQPLRLRFPSTEPVYPMRMSQAAGRPQSLSIWVIAPDRMAAEFTPVSDAKPTLQYAGTLDPANISAISRVGQWVTQRSILVRYDQTISDPSAITSDFTFAPAGTDDSFRAVVYAERDLGWLTGGLLSVLGLVLLAVIPTRILYRRRVRRERAADMAQGY